MSDTEQPARWPYHIPLYIVGIALGAGSLVCQVLMLAGFSTVLRPISVTLASLGGIIVAATALHRKIGLESAERLKVVEVYGAARRAEIQEMIGAMGQLAYDFRRVVAFAEQGIGISHDVSGALDEVNKRIDEVSKTWDGERLQAISDRLDELTRDFAQSQVAQLHRGSRNGRSSGSGESGYS